MKNEPLNEPLSWEAIRANFNLDYDLIHMSGLYLTSHPKPVRKAIEKYHRLLNANPTEFHRDHCDELDAAVTHAAASYLGVDASDIALTDSTTMGLALVYSGLKLTEDHEILTTTHDHFASDLSLELSVKRTGAKLRKITLYNDAEKVSSAQILQNIIQNITDKTRILAVTWVHSCTGVKLPLRAIADALLSINSTRNKQDRILLCVDGVHGHGVDSKGPLELGCDFFIAGCHKWLFGPRGTGLIWGTRDAWARVDPIIPTFDTATYKVYMGILPPCKTTNSARMTPGGFHSFEHRWALKEAFQFHEAIGKLRAEKRIQLLNRQLKEGMAKMPHIKLYTPLEDNLSAGIVCFDVAGMDPFTVIDRLREKRIITSITPYKTQYPRLTPGLINSPEEVDHALQTLHELRL